MPPIKVPYALITLAFSLCAMATTAARAEFFGCEDQHRVHRVAYTSTSPEPLYSRHFAAQAHPHITIYPRHRAVRHCRSWLAKEYRLSGPVIVPHKYCWWR
jgi:hypothetical protein